MKRLTESIKARLPVYLHYLKSLPSDDKTTISSASIAEGLGLGEVQVRKDLARVSGAGKPKIGYYLGELTEHIEDALGIKPETTNAVIVGAGKLGKALLLYDGFSEFGLNLLAAFDKDESKAGELGNRKAVYPIGEIENFCRENNVKIGVITVPEASAGDAYETLIGCGVTAVWNFSPVRIRGTDKVKVKNENLAASLAVLAADL
ncbi:MAG: redox-sensing transcriptional repressor Rex [Clostridiales bacterium]|nr:redox-sensing transcriptional repressor Rex [Clostridiales bacterium]